MEATTFVAGSCNEARPRGPQTAAPEQVRRDATHPDGSRFHGPASMTALPELGLHRAETGAGPSVLIDR